MFKLLRKPSETIASLHGIDRGGIYVVTLQNAEALGMQFAEAFENRFRCDTLPTNAIYIGMGNSLRNRLRQEFLQTGRATFFRSIGALKNMQPFRGQNTPANYMFDEPQTDQIIDFMEKNMLVGYEFIDSNEECLSKEKELITSCHPLINIQHNDGFTYPGLIAARLLCRQRVGEPVDMIYNNEFVKLVHKIYALNYIARHAATDLSGTNVKILAADCLQQ